MSSSNAQSKADGASSEARPDINVTSEEFHSETRIELLMDLAAALPKGNRRITPIVWACLWLSDIPKLRELVDYTQRYSLLGRSLLDNIDRLRYIVPKWIQPRDLPAPEPVSLPPQSSPAFHYAGATDLASIKAEPPVVIEPSKYMRSLCFSRDQETCVVTGTRLANNIAHIYSPAVCQKDHLFWNLLRRFWEDRRVDAWYNAVFPSSTEVCSNMLCLSHQARAYWERGYFALKPIYDSEDKTRLDVQFFWLSPHKHSNVVDILRPPFFCKDLDSSSIVNKVGLYSVDAKREIRSGDVMTITTDDPVVCPLPDRQLLDMQWVLHRVTAMSGGAELEDPIGYEEEFDGPVWEERDAYYAGYKVAPYIKV